MPRGVLLRSSSERGPVTELLLWFLVSQTLSGLPAMAPGTEVRVVSPDLLTIYATGQVAGGVLAFGSAFPPNAEVLVLVFPPGTTEAELAETLAGAAALRAQVDADGTDLRIAVSEGNGTMSFRTWLEEERGLELVIDAVED